jgi:hypothetical protein
VESASFPSSGRTRLSEYRETWRLICASLYLTLP